MAQTVGRTDWPKLTPAKIRRRNASRRDSLGWTQPRASRRRLRDELPASSPSPIPRCADQPSHAWPGHVRLRSIIDILVRANNRDAVRRDIVDRGETLQCEITVLVDRENRHMRYRAVPVDDGGPATMVGNIGRIAVERRDDRRVLDDLLAINGVSGHGLTRRIRREQERAVQRDPAWRMLRAGTGDGQHC